MKLDRREFFKTTAGVTALTLGLNAFSPAILRRKLLAAPPTPGNKRLIFIFLRGGNDVINTFIPRGDPNYSARNRPTLMITNAIRLDGTQAQYPIDAALQNGFLELHPALAPLMPVYQQGDLALIHRVGYPNQTQSHFDGELNFERGQTNNAGYADGMLYRQAAETLNILTNRVAAISLSGSQMSAFRGNLPIPTIPDVRTFKFAGAQSRTLKFLGRLPEPGQPGRGVLGAYGGPKDSPTKPYRDLVYQTGLSLADSMSIIQANGINPDTYVPANGAVYPANGSTYFKAKQIAQLLKETPVQMVGMNIGGFDTHTNQGAYTGGHPNLLTQIANTIRAWSLDLQGEVWDNTVVVTVSEFGRTSLENGSMGTDHGQAIGVFLAGGGVNGGVYNAPDAATWNLDGGILSSASGRYLKHWTDFRAVFGEIFMKHFGDDLATLNRVIPGYSAAATARPKEFAQLGFL